MGTLPYIQISAENGEPVPEDVRRVIAALLGTRRGEMETDRAYGIAWDALDKPVPEAMRMITLDVVMQIPKYETRCRVVRVDFDAEDARGILGVKVVIEV